jgi:hypothetical protein
MEFSNLQAFQNLWKQLEKKIWSAERTSRVLVQQYDAKGNGILELSNPKKREVYINFLGDVPFIHFDQAAIPFRVSGERELIRLTDNKILSVETLADDIITFLDS